MIVYLINHVYSIKYLQFKFISIIIFAIINNYIRDYQRRKRLYNMQLGNHAIYLRIMIISPPDTEVSCVTNINRYIQGQE